MNRIENPYEKGSAAYSFSMLLYYLLHVFYFKRQDPDWLQEAYFIAFALPGLISLKYLPLSLKEHTYRHFFKYCFYIMVSFALFSMLTDKHLIIFKRWVSAAIMFGMPIVFLILFLKFKGEKKEIL